MTKSLVAAVLFSLSLASGALAQDDLRAAAERYVRLPAVQQVLDFVLGPNFLQPILAMAGGDQIEAAKRDRIIAIATEEMARARPAMENAMIEAAAKVFTLPELEVMVAFYGSEVGASTLAKTQMFSQAYLAAMTDNLARLQIAVENRIQLEVGE